MSSLFVACLPAIVSYLIGSIPFGYLIGKFKGVDLFQAGSGNIGATNAGRVLGRKYGLLVFVMDFLKGAVPVACTVPLVRLLDSNILNTAGSSELLRVSSALMAFLGHLFPLYLGFRGGKGVATGAGVVVVLVPIAASMALVVWFLIALLTRYVSLASILAATALSLAQVLFTPNALGHETWPVTTFCFLGTAIVIIKHRSNLARLFAGSESQIGDGSMRQFLIRGLHILALGMWFGGAAFFNFVSAPTIFDSFKTVVQESPSDRTAHVPILPSDASTDTKESLARALAGSAVGPIFPKYFLMQTICAALALVTAMTWFRSEPARSAHRWRVYLLVVSLLIIAISWPLSNYISELRLVRFHADPQIADAAKKAFGQWHMVSLLLSFLTTGLAGYVLLLAAKLPQETRPASE